MDKNLKMGPREDEKFEKNATCSGKKFEIVGPKKSWTFPPPPGSHCPRKVPDRVPSNFNTCEHFDYNIASITNIVINSPYSSKPITELFTVF